MRKSLLLTQHISFHLLLIFFLSSCSSNPEANGTEPAQDSAHQHTGAGHHPEMEMQKMMKAQQGKPQENPYKDAKIEIRVFKNDTINHTPKLNGFGYDILIYDAVYNHQPHIPAINGMRGFHTYEQAHRAAQLVVHKIRNNIMPPSLSPKELDSLGTLN